VWEVAIKRALGKLEAPPEWASVLLGAGAQPLQVRLDHAAAVEDLPPHHSDPFERLLVSQASIEGATIVSRDEALPRYGVPVLW
jgi:PIN domain nuclease of toxin-antitoxin system